MDTQYSERRPTRDFLTVREIAQKLGVGESFVRIRIWRKELPAYRVGTQLRVHTFHLKAWLDACRTDRPPPSVDEKDPE